MKIVSWNVNGLVACKRKGFLKVLANSKADVFCCQEIKVQCPLSTPSYLQFWNPAQRPGYSGTLPGRKDIGRCHVVKNDFKVGIEGIKWRTEEEMMRAALSLTSKGYHAKPCRRIIITGNGKNRTIDVPVAYDKAMQALYLYSLDPVANATADRKSFAARKGRSSFNAHAYLCMSLEGDNAPEWICKGDVTGE